MAPPRRRRLPARAPAGRIGEGPAADWGIAIAIAAVLCLITFYAKGGLSLETMTVTEMALTCAAGLGIGLAVLLAPARGGLYGVWSVGLLLAFAVLTAVSVVWSVQPDESWQDAARMFAYCGVFAGAVALVRADPRRWAAVIGGVTLAAAIVCAYALLSRIFPGEIGATSSFARLDEPYGYWNAIGLTAALGAICCLWLGARRSGHALLSALAYPAMGLMLLTLLLAYSRGALAALAVGVVLWLCIVPLRLRGAAVLIAGGLGAGAVAAWDFSRHALSSEGVALAERTSAGHRLGALVVAMLLLLALVGVAVGFLSGRRAPSIVTRRRAGATLLALLALALLGFAGVLAHSHRGFTGSISHAVDSLTNPNAKPPSNTAGRLTAVASVRARYWKEALQVFNAHKALGAGALGYHTARKRYRNVTIDVQHAHGFVVQTLADLGIVGLATALALLACWMAAAGRATHPLNRRWTGWRELRSRRLPRWRRVPAPYSAERIGLLTMLCVVVVFGVHSFVDWTWYVPGDAAVALLLAGWLAGRGPLAEQPAPRVAGAEAAAPAPRRPSWAPPLWRERLAEPGRTRIAVAVAVLAAALLAAWSQWQPQRAEDARLRAIALVASDPRAALASAQTAVARDPLSVQALFALSAVQQAAGETAPARATLQRGVKLQPSNPETWLHLGLYEIHANPRMALSDLAAAIYLDPQSIAPELISGPRASTSSIELQNAYIQALRASALPAPIRSGSAPLGRAGGAAPRAARRRVRPPLRSESPRATP
ncbi:MAG TPA: O-antigen ligase family protein [Solirubrobacteraceae bacterium]|nr:O-antigen ligase family protein [Solirubrobacteraceae bacterium]